MDRGNNLNYANSFENDKRQCENDGRANQAAKHAHYDWQEIPRPTGPRRLVRWVWLLCIRHRPYTYYIAIFGNISQNSDAEHLLEKNRSEGVDDPYFV